MAERPFFVPTKEVDFFDAVNEELIDGIIGQTVDIYKVSLEETETNVYGEAVGGGQKVFEKGYRVNCLILFNEPDVSFEDHGTDVNASIEMYFHRNSLKEANFLPEIGDIVDWDGFYWEINGITEPQLIAGHQGFKHQIKATASRTRTSSVNIDERTQ